MASPWLFLKTRQVLLLHKAAGYFTSLEHLLRNTFNCIMFSQWRNIVLTPTDNKCVCGWGPRRLDIVSAINEHTMCDHHSKHPVKICGKEKNITMRQEEYLLLNQSVDDSKEKLPNGFIATEWILICFNVMGAGYEYSECIHFWTIASQNWQLHS